MNVTADEAHLSGKKQQWNQQNIQASQEETTLAILLTRQYGVCLPVRGLGVMTGDALSAAGLSARVRGETFGTKRWKEAPLFCSAARSSRSDDDR